LTSDGPVAWSAAHSAWGQVVAEHADPPVGARLGRPVASPFRLLGQIADEELGLCFTTFRMFDPAVGRWCSPDPLGLLGGGNLYGFNGSPTCIVDPLGLSGSPHIALPPGARVLDDKSPSHVVYETADGEQRIRFRASDAVTMGAARPGRNYSTEARAGVNDQGQPYVFEGRHRAVGVAQGGSVGPDLGGVPGSPGYLDYKHDASPVSGGVPVKSLTIDNSEPDVSAEDARQIRRDRYGVS
jgi:RHS repeat-associated protein